MRDGASDLLFQSVNRLLEGASSDAFELSGQNLRVEVAGKQLLDVDEVSISGQGITLICGPNGAGKSLFVRVLQGLFNPTQGQVRVQGQQIDRKIRRLMAMVFQKPVLLRRSVAANLRYAMRARGIPKAEREARLPFLLDLAGLTGKEKQPARSLSGGEEQCLALAAALASRPKLLFLDEPTSSLDPGATYRIETILRFAATCGTRIVMVTHDMAQAARLGDDILFLSKGRIVERQKVSQFFEQPRSAEGQSYLRGQLIL